MKCIWGLISCFISCKIKWVDLSLAFWSMWMWRHRVVWWGPTHLPIWINEHFLNDWLPLFFYIALQYLRLNCVVCFMWRKIASWIYTFLYATGGLLNVGYVFCIGEAADELTSEDERPKEARPYFQTGRSYS